MPQFRKLSGSFNGKALDNLYHVETVDRYILKVSDESHYASSGDDQRSRDFLVVLVEMGQERRGRADRLPQTPAPTGGPGEGGTAAGADTPA